MLSVIINNDNVLAFHPETGKEMWRRSLGVYILDDREALTRAEVRVLEDIVRIICPRFEIVLDAETGRVKYKRPRRRGGTGKRSSGIDVSLEELLRALEDEADL